MFFPVDNFSSLETIYQKTKIIYEDSHEEYIFIPIDICKLEIYHCIICMDDIQPSSELFTLRCTHYFHAECINNWLRKRPTCPICRRRN